MKIKFKKRWILLSFILIILISITAIDLIRISGYKTYVRRPTKEIKLQESQVYAELVEGETITDWNRLDGTLEYIKSEYDCSDFRLVNLIRILYEFNDSIPVSYMAKIEGVLTGFRYWMDEPGGNSMCYWSENHQILFASAEYLIGQKYPKKNFQNSGLTGEQHIKKARKRILDWLKMRWDYGFTEYYSNVYYKEDIGALVNLIDYAEDEEIVKKCQIIMDLLFYDVASQSRGTLFISTSGRAYENQRKLGSMGEITNYFWGNGRAISPGMTYGLEVTNNYNIPPVLKEIGRDTSTVTIKRSNGLDLEELSEEGFFGTDTRSIMMQWGMEAFTNPIIVRNSISYIRSNGMFTNDFIADFKVLDFSILKWLHLEPLIVKILNPQTNGVAIQRADTYTYKTKDYSMYTVQNHQVGDYANQDHVFGMNIRDSFAIFHSHPATEIGKGRSPSYWVGYGHLPHSVQDKNINLSIYSLPARKGLMEMNLLGFTHAYFPKLKFDKVLVEKNYAFGKKGETYCALIGANGLNYRDGSEDDIIQKGKKVFWITEAGSRSEDDSFEKFIERIKNNDITFDTTNTNLTYYSKGNKYEVVFNGNFKINDKTADTNYRRYNSPYANAKRKAKTLTFEKNGLSLFLDFENMKREFIKYL